MVRTQIVMRAIVAVALGALVAGGVGGCQGKRSDGGAGAGSASVPSVEPRGEGGGKFGSAASAPDPDPASGSAAAAGAGAARSGDSARPVAEEPETPPDANKQIAELGAIPAWQAVIDRSQLLARRGQRGVVYGRLGPVIMQPEAAGAGAGSAGAGSAGAGSAGAGSAGAGAGSAGSGSGSAAAPEVASPYSWLIDDSEGNGSLGIRIALGTAKVKEGDRIAASGAWDLDAERRWYWKADAIQPLAPRTPSPNDVKDPPAAVPSHVPAAAPLPPGARPIKLAKDNDLVVFQLAGPPPAREGDGWLVSSGPGEAPVALLLLPGERSSYGGLDMRSPDERWQLKRQTNYWIRIGKIRPQSAGKPFIVYGRTAPVRVQ